MAFVHSMEAMQKVCDALGIDWRGRAITRLVIELAVNEPVRAYVQEFVRTDAVEGIAGALVPEAVEVIPVADLVVDERTGDVKASDYEELASRIKGGCRKTNGSI